MRIAAVGECTIDHYVDRGAAHVGGISLNFAIHAKRAGASDVRLVSCTGSDIAGDVIRAALGANGIDATHVATRPGRSASQRIRLATDGERTFPAGGYDPGVLADFRFDDAALTMLATADVIAVPVFRQLMPLLDPVIHARDLGALRVADLLDGADLALGESFDALAPLLDTFDVLFVSGDDVLVERLLPISRATRSVLVVTHGGAGSTSLVRGVRHRIDAVAVPPDECVDTTGCGDAYQAAFTVSFARDRDILAAMHAGAERAARVIRHLGAFADER